MRDLPMLQLLLAIVALVASGCATAPRTGEGEPQTPRLEDREWRLVALRGGELELAPGARAPHVAFESEPGVLRGHGGVNSFFGAYALDGESLRVERLASTKMAGPPEAMRVELELLRALEESRSWRIAQDRLELRDAYGAVLARFVPDADR